MSTPALDLVRIASVEAALPSTRLTAAAAAERSRLERETRRLEQRAEAITAELQRLVEAREEIRQQVNLLDQIAPTVSPTDRESRTGEEYSTLSNAGEPPNGYLKGARIRAVAVRLLAASEHADRPIHYQAWFELLVRAGFGIKAQDPLGTFLTQVTRSPVVQKADGPGVYRLDVDAPRELHQELRRLQDELLRLHSGQQTLEGIASVRERRAELTAEIAQVERALEEAASAVGLEP
jgi:predicted ribosome quality control (RQC) complex YloA/Tae2 family protein